MSKLSPTNLKVKIGGGGGGGGGVSGNELKDESADDSELIIGE